MTVKRIPPALTFLIFGCTMAFILQQLDINLLIVITAFNLIIIMDLTLKVTPYDFNIERKIETEYYGNEILRNEKMFPSERSVYISPHNGVMQGIVMEMYVYIESSTDVYLQVWRPRVLERITGSFNLTLIGQKLLPGTHTGNYSIMLSPEERFLVEEGDMLGFTIDGNMSPVSTHFTNDPNIYHLRAELGPTGDLPMPGDTLTFHTLDMPYKFSYGVAIIPGVYNLSVSHLYETIGFFSDCDKINHDCDQICGAFDERYICSCSPGFILNSDQRTCSDIDECEADNGNCEYNCTNTLGGYRCTCPDGFQLSTNHHSCIYLQETCEKLQCASDEKCLQGYRRAYCIGKEVIHLPTCTGAMSGIVPNVTSKCGLRLDCDHMIAIVAWCVILTIVLLLIVGYTIIKVVLKTQAHKKEQEAVERKAEEDEIRIPYPDFASFRRSPEPYERSPPAFESDNDAQLALML